MAAIKNCERVFPAESQKRELNLILACYLLHETLYSNGFQILQWFENVEDQTNLISILPSIPAFDILYARAQTRKKFFNVVIVGYFS